MKKNILLFFLAPYLCFAQIELKGVLTSGNSGTDIWEYIDDTTGNVYAIVGGIGLSIVDVTDPTNPTEVVHINSVPGFDVKVWKNYVYCATGSSSGDAAIVDISDPTNPVEVGTFPSAHNFHIDERGYMYNSSPGVRIYDLNLSPTNPTFLTQVGDEGHDVTVRGNIMIDCHGFSGTYIYDVTDPANPSLITVISDPTITYHHQGDISTDGNYVYICDELGNHPQADISVWDISNPAAPVRVSDVADATATAHNLYVLGDFAYTAYYTAGFKVFDISDPSVLALADEYDTNSTSGETFSGAFGVYPSPETGNIYINDGSGVYVFGFGDVAGVDDLVNSPISIVPNPAQVAVTISSEDDPIQSIKVYSMLGKLVMDVNTTSIQDHRLDISALKAGVYFVKVNDHKAHRLLVE